MTPDFPDATATVCHDAGASNIVIEALLETGRKDWHAYMRGPAEKLWKAAFPEVALSETLDSTLEGMELLISGTGWASDIEHNARKLAHTRGIRSVALIDHWVNYTERFVRNGEIVWPDEFWVTDKYAMTIAKQSFPGQTILQVPNYYVDTQLSMITSVDEVTAPELLYILEPARSDWGRGVQGEFQALDYFLSHLPQMGLPPETVIRLRPHPSDAPGKYNDWVSKHSTLSIEIDNTISIAQSIGRSSWVAGCESFALVLALMASRKVYCSLPPWAPACRLPHHELIHIARQDACL